MTSKKYQPEVRYLIKPNIGLVFYLSATSLAYIYFYPNKDIVSAYILLGLYLAFLIFLAYQYVYLRKLSWIITDEQIIYTRGIIAVNKDYLELYRIYDFSEYNSLFDRILGLKNIKISSTDQSSPILTIYGIPSSIDILSPLRNRIEKSKAKRRIYEMSNH